MGLDMYLSAKKFLWPNTREDMESQKSNPLVQDVIAAGIPFVSSPMADDGFKLSYVEIQIGYWRKANAIHGWFVKNIQDGNDDCRDYWVMPDQLKQLKEKCAAILLAPQMAPEFLPSREGFFFGGTDYDEWYFRDLNETMKIVDRALTLPKSWDIHYRASW